MGKIIFLAVFITLSGLFIAQGVNLWRESNSGNWDTLHGYEILGNYTFVSLLPYGGYDFTEDNASDYVYPVTLVGTGTAFIFDEDDLESDDAVRVWVICDNALYNPALSDGIFQYLDYFYIRCDYGGFLGMFDTYAEMVSFEDVVDNQLGNTNCSLTPVTLGHRHYTLFVNTTGDGSSFDNDLYGNSFTVSMVLTTEDQTPSGSMWAIIGQILTMDIPNVHWLVNLILFTISWSMIAVIVIEVWARLWPL